MGDKRIALCLSGIVGGKGGPNGKGGVVDIKTIFNQYQKHILDKNNVDVFIHSWSIDYEEIVNMLSVIEEKLPNGEVKKINKNLSEIKKGLIKPFKFKREKIVGIFMKIISRIKSILN